VFKFIATTKTQYNLIFADPPYALPALPTLPNLIFEHQLLKPDGWLILEHSTNQSFDNHPNFIQKRNYGETAFSIFEQPITTTN
jgi:16S rRNA G966 N2-methylase RsmD